MDRPLSAAELVKLRMHLLLCGNCRQFSRQMGEMRAAARHAGEGRD
ncbi:zf-HC2 domain-containing protein [Chromobacterium sp. IIBBL 290-4]|nr:zf-HC2 domain-containing protein [Chromobacterium sp. IIBBL 290-4]